MGQIERALNRFYGVETGPADAAEVRPRAAAGLRQARLPARVRRTRVRRSDRVSFADRRRDSIWDVVRWPFGIALLVAAMRCSCAGRRAGASRRGLGSSFGALVGVGLVAWSRSRSNLFFQLQHHVRRDLWPARRHHRAALWALLSSVAFLFGAASRRSSRPFVPAPPGRGASEGRRIRPGRATAEPEPVGRQPDVVTRPRRPTLGRRRRGVHRRAAPCAGRDHRRAGDRGQPIDVLATATRSSPRCSTRSPAEHSIDLLTFVYWHGDIGTRFAQALAERARAGVRVRVLLDALGRASDGPSQ